QILREQLDNEDVHCGAMCSQLRNGKKCVYRMGEDPEKDGVLIDASKDDLHVRMVFKCIHRGKALFTKVRKNLDRPFARKLSPKIIVIELPLSNSVVWPHANDSSSLAYFATGMKLRVLDLDTLEFLPDLSFGEYADGKAMVRREVYSLKAVIDGT
ncbi:hypothetical protein PMAYCL1PPCAC_08836, partial [Pristionchus mayeri]